ncbi:MAG: hypothetical protein ACR2NZ_05475 [Rubripirellula sp.]
MQRRHLYPLAIVVLLAAFFLGRSYFDWREALEASGVQEQAGALEPTVEESTVDMQSDDMTTDGIPRKFEMKPTADVFILKLDPPTRPNLGVEITPDSGSVERGMKADAIWREQQHHQIQLDPVIDATSPRAFIEKIPMPNGR